MTGIHSITDRAGTLVAVLGLTALTGCFGIGGPDGPPPLATAQVNGVQYRVDAVEAGAASGVAQSPLDLAGAGSGWVVSRADGKPMTSADEQGAYRAFAAHCKGLIGPGNLSQHQGKSVYRFRECNE